jgi:branched-chain amino acid transport system ATP-binding protein
MAELLVLDGVCAGYGEAIVISDICLRLDEGRSLAVLGRNGVGKSTLMLALLGHLPLRSGKIVMRGADITDKLPHERVTAGLGWVPQGRECFPSLTVDEHLVIATRKGPWNRERVYELFPRLSERMKNMGNQLSGGEQQMLAIGRGLMTNPKLLILDEATEGLAPRIRNEIWGSLKRLKAEGQAILLVDKHIDALLKLADRHVVIEKGHVVWSGSSAALADDPTVRQRYLQV